MMNGIAEKAHLEPTAAMALYLGQAIYAGNAYIEQYLQRVDLSSGVPMAEKMKMVLPALIPVSENRKYVYHQHILKSLHASQSPAEVIILGVGYDPVSVHLLNTEADRIERILEIDMSSLALKKTLFEEIRAPHMHKIKFLQTNVLAENFQDSLQTHGYDRSKPAIVTMEGMVYYLQPQQLVDLLRPFRSANQTNSFCIDYIYPWENSATAEWQKQHQMVQGIVEKSVGLPHYIYSAQQMVELVKNAGGVDIEVQTMHDVEKLRTGDNRFFTQRGTGIFEFITFKI